MKKYLLFLLIMTIQQSTFSQSENEKIIRQLDSLEVVSFLKNDLATMLSLWDENYVVANPFNKVVNLPEIKALMANQNITKVSFVRNIERITFNENIAIVMGVETPDKNLAEKGVPEKVLLPRRFTNIWMKKNLKWKLVARQASNF